MACKNHSRALYKLGDT